MFSPGVDRTVLTEADTSTRYVVPRLRAAGWDDSPHSFAQEHSFTDGRIILVGTRVKRKEKKRADFLLQLTRDFTIAVVEVRSEERPAGEGLQQAKVYAEMLELKFAFSTNGRQIIAFDYLTGQETKLRELRNCHGILSTIPPESGWPPEDPAALPKGTYRRLMKTRFNAKAYRQRTQAETVFSMLKSNLGSALRGRSHWSRCRDMMLRVITRTRRAVSSRQLICFDPGMLVRDHRRRERQIQFAMEYASRPSRMSHTRTPTRSFRRR